MADITTRKFSTLLQHNRNMIFFKMQFDMTYNNLLKFIIIIFVRLEYLLIINVKVHGF